MSIRSFIALELSAEARAEVSRAAKELKSTGADVKWVQAGSIHMTLKFLGNIEEDKVPAVAKRLDGVAAMFPAFNAALGELGSFPKWEYAKVIWIGIGEGADEMTSVAKGVEDAMAAEGFHREDRKFSPHVTIGRVRTPKNSGRLAKAASSIMIEPVRSRVSRIVLFKSELTPQGPVYTPLYEAGLSRDTSDK
jgi:2'-5' RNA ligase